MTELLHSAEFLLAGAARRHAGYALLRGRGAVSPITLRSGETGYLVVGFEAARRALTDPRLHGRTATLGNRRGMSADLRRAMNSHMLNAGPDDHARLRRLVSAAFTRRRMEGMRPRVQAITDGLLDAVAAGGSGRADLIAALALPLPVRVLIDMFGIPEEDAGDFHRWTDALTTSALPLDRLDATAAEMLGYIRGLLDRKRRAPRPDLLSALVAVRDGGDRLSEDELTSMVFLLLTAGHETTVNLIGNGLLALLSHPGRLQAVRADPGLLPAAVEETLRFESPVQVALRYCVEPMDLDGTPIPAGATVLVSLLGANRDPARFPDPDTLDPERADNPQLAFGYGVHHCIGAPLARIEGVVAIGSVLARFPELRLAEPADGLEWRPSVIMHGLTALPVVLGPARDAAADRPAGTATKAGQRR
ncbi:cytochrome P450 family protein [Actinomadura opuntiae]|uniref:cytochrome P450 family protein n=1 Tax=Actinomadura sp. OS1-43 TaxID=604315 RepID=UPI00255AABA0|nr:cytochrome P450 [Actinomadura sp. OS1-43]MDL4820233.1 cytochrome P450 [Actinomadura sp. OS1-43]